MNYRNGLLPYLRIGVSGVTGVTGVMGVTGIMGITGVTGRSGVLFSRISTTSSAGRL